MSFHIEVGGVAIGEGRGIRGTVVAPWIACQQVERLILHQGHDSEQNLSH